jgi:Pentapeptide repeats (8 copies)
MRIESLEQKKGCEVLLDSPAALLRCGVEKWNAFRREYPDYIILNCTCLADAQLAHIDMHCVLLMESDFRRANLTNAILARAILRNSDFRNSDLQRAILDGADLCRADLSGADLRGASLVSAFLKRADLTGADLSTALGLTTAQINEAYGDGRTLLPEHVVRPASWSS